MKYPKVTHLLGLLMVGLMSACASVPSQPDSENPTIKPQPDLEKALGDFRKLPELEPYFNDARAIVIIPNNFRAGTGFGGAVGKGWLVQGGLATDVVFHWQLLAGADLGLQLYQQILFLKDDNAVAFFKQEPFQFAGQVNATAIVWGKGLNPSYNDGVALFTLIDGGLMLEASVGLHSYHVFPLKNQ